MQHLPHLKVEAAWDVGCLGAVGAVGAAGAVGVVAEKQQRAASGTLCPWKVAVVTAREVVSLGVGVTCRVDNPLKTGFGWCGAKSAARNPGRGC